MSSTQNKKIMDEIHDLMRIHHYSIHTERSYCDWIKRYIQFHKMKSRDDLNGGEAKIEQFLTYLAIDGQVSPSTQNQAMNALVFRSAAQKAGIHKRITAHTFRHSFATHLLMRGTDIRTIQSLLGHKEVAKIMIYTHVLEQSGYGVTSPLDDLESIKGLPVDMEL